MKPKKKPQITLDVKGVVNWHGHEARIDVVGAGTTDYEFAEAPAMVAAALKSVKIPRQTLVGKTITRIRDRRSAKRRKGGTGEDAGAKRILPTKVPELLHVISKLPDEPSDRLGKTLIRGATGMQERMKQRQLDGLVYANFGADVGTLNWGINNMPEFRDGLSSLNRQYDVLIPRWKEALLGLLKELQTKYPKVPQGVLLPQAIKALNEQLGGFRFISGVYCDSVSQYRDGKYDRPLKAINMFYRQAAALFKHVDPDSPGKVADGLDSIKYKVGDKYLSRFTAMGLATIPGPKGPVGIHALQMPFDFLDLVALMFPLVGHEFRHNVWNDIVNLEDEMRDAVRDALHEAYRTKKLKLHSETMKLGEQTVNTIDMLTKFYTDSIGEIDADISGGVLLSGTAYAYNMLLSFPAMMVRGQPLEQAKKLLRTDSSYKLIPQGEGKVALVFEPHPPDYIRAYIVAAALEDLGFTAEAAECRRLADFAIGGNIPDKLRFVDGSDEEDEDGDGQEAVKSDMVIEFWTEDMKAAAPIVARTLMRQTLPSMGGRSTIQMLDWNPAREKKVERIAEILMAGGTEVPTDLGTVYATTVGAGTTMGYWRKLHSGGDIDPASLALKMSDDGMSMIHGLIGRGAA